MPLQIFVEDQLSEAYEVLARKVLGLSFRDRRQVHASRIDPEDFTSRDGLLDWVSRSLRSHYDCVVFILDEEAGPQSADRPEKLRLFKRAFQELCTYLGGLPEQDPLKGMNVIRIVCQRCLESWLVSDPQAVVDSVRGKQGINFKPKPGRTENLTPRQASEYIAHLINQTGQQMRRRDLQRIGTNSIKSRGKSIAEHVNPDQARRYNRSLRYFYEMVPCTQNGCDKPFPK